MKSVIHFGCNFSPAAYNGTLPGSPILLCAHEFRATADGQLEHLMDGNLVATVPPEGLGDYLVAWPAGKPVIDELRGAEGSARATLMLPAPDNLSGLDAPGI